MPLTASGSKVLRSMQDTYGAQKGERVFYATAQKTPEVAKKWHGPKPSTPRSLSKR